MSIAIELNNLSKKYKNKTIPALSSVSLSIPRGTIASILGPNGAGKTTLVKIIIGILHPTAGDGTVCGNSLGSLSAKKLLGYVPEHLRLPSMLSPQKALKLFGNLSGLSGKILQSRIDEVLEQVSMSDVRHTPIHTFSKGTTQRIGIAQALINRPSLLILDEPTDGIDPQGRIEIKNIIATLNAQGTTILINSHILTEIEQITHSFYILDQGRLAREGTIEELMTSKHKYIIECSHTESFDDISEELRHIDIFGTPNKMSIKTTATSYSLCYDFSTTEQLNACLDILRSNNVHILSIERQQSSLEDIFMQTIASSPSK